MPKDSSRPQEKLYFRSTIYKTRFLKVYGTEWKNYCRTAPTERYG